MLPCKTVISIEGRTKIKNNKNVYFLDETCLNCNNEPRKMFCN